MLMYNKLIILFGFIGLLLSQEVFVTQQEHLHGGAKYLISNEESPSVKFHAITVNQAVVGHTDNGTCANCYSMDFGIWAFYLKEPDAVIVEASDGDPTVNGIDVTFMVDPLSPPATLIDVPDNINNYDLGGYASSNQVSDYVVAVTKTQDGNTSTALVNTQTDYAMKPGAAYPWQQDVRPGIMYSFGVTGFNSFGLSPEGTDIGFTLPNGRVEGTVTVPGSVPGTTGNGVKDVEIKLHRADGQTIGSSLYLDGVDDYLYADNIYDELLLDTLQTNDISIELWFKNSSNPSREYIIDMSPMLSIYQENNYIHAKIGDEVVVCDTSLLTSYMPYWHHISVNKGDRGACLRDAESFEDDNNNDQWDGGELYDDLNENSFYDPAGPISGVVSSYDCVSAYADSGEVFTWDPTYYAYGIQLYLDGVLVDSKSVTSTTLVSGEVINVGREINGTNWYNGYIDDIRIWDHARTEDEILKNKARFLSAQENGLLGYWKMDAGMLNKAYNLIKYEEPVPNTEYKIQVGNNFTIQGSDGTTSPWWVSDSPDQYISSFTDSNGNYAIKNIAYDATGWDGTQFSITPYKENHNYFDPPGRTAYIRLDYYEHHNISFTDNSLLAVTGKIHYQGFENCAIDSAEVQIKYLGDLEFHSTEPPTYTENGGIFRIDIEPEKTFVIKAVYKDHIFPQTYSHYNITNDKVNNFEDLTINKTLHGSISAGICENQDGIDIGPYTIEYTEKNECLSVSLDNQIGTAFEITGLPPLEYNVKIIPENGEANLTQDILVANLDDYNQETVLPGQADNALVYKHYPPLKVEINKVSERIFVEESGCVDLSGLSFGWCDAIIGFGFVNNTCQHITGCDSESDGTDYSDAFFDSMEECEMACNGENMNVDTTYVDLIPDCNDGTYIFEQGRHYSSYFTVKEAYSYIPQNGSSPYEGDCIMESFKFNVIDNITNHSITDDILIEAGPTGEVEYFFTARVPNIVGDLISDGIDGYPNTGDDGENYVQSGFTQYIRFDGLDSDDSIGRPKGESKLFAYIDGIMEDPDQINVNTSTSEIPFFVLRDPPGDASYSYLSEEQQVCQSMTISDSDGFEGNVSGTISLGSDFTCDAGFSAFGVTFSTELEVDITNDLGYGFTYTSNSVSSTETSNCFTVSSTYSTSDDENFTGGSGDIFVGSGLSMTYSKAIDQETQPNDDGECIVTQGSTYTYGVDGLVNTYMHTESFIENTMIPQLEAQAPLDDAYQEQADYWKYLIALNDSAKAQAVPANYDLLSADPGGETTSTYIDWSAGTIYEFSKTSESSFTSSHEFEYTEAHELNRVLGVNVNGVGFEVGASATFSSGEAGGDSESSTNSKTNGFVFADDDPGDHFLVEIKEDQVWGMPVYKLIGGQSECPWEIPTMKRYDPILQAAGPDGAFGDIADIDEIGEYDAAQLSFQIANNSPTLEGKDYMFRLLNESNPLGALVTYNGQPMTSPFQISVDAPIEHMGCQYSSACQIDEETPCGVCGVEEIVTCEVSEINGEAAVVSLCNAQDQSVYSWVSMYMPGVSEATVYVRKDDASDEFNYEGLIFEQYAGCAEGDPEQTYSTTANVSFEKPCTNVTLVAPEFGEDVDWQINGNDGDTLMVRISEFELMDPETSNDENLDHIYIQYADTGTEDWILLQGASVSLDDLSIEGGLSYYNFELDMSTFTEQIGGSAYKLRAVTFCSEFNKNYSDVLNGFIDTEPPNAFQLEPADNVLSGGDEISISYEEILDCDFIDHAVFSAQNMTMSSSFSTASPGLIPTCIDNKVVLNIDGSVAPYKVENDTIRIEALYTRDLLGNIDSTGRVWEFFFNQNPISWSEPVITRDIYLGDDVEISAILQNIGGGTSSFEFGVLNNIPEWLYIDPMEGWLNSQGQTDITFTLDPYMDIGSYYETIYAENSSGHEPIALDLNVLCRPPEWDYNVSSYQYSMTIVAELGVLNDLSMDPFDRVVATIDGEIRGAAQLEQIYTGEESGEVQITYLTYLTIYGNSADEGNQIEFRIWDNDNCRELWNIVPSISAVYYNNQYYGSFNSPVTLNAPDLSTAQHIDLNSGWTWISLNLQSDDMTVSNALSYLDPSSGDQIINFNDGFYSSYSVDQDGWVGSQNILNNQYMYQLNLQQEDRLTFVGLEVASDSNMITYNAGYDNQDSGVSISGWNWIAYTPQNVLEIDEALSLIDASTVDLIKGQYGFSEYVNSAIGWVGSLSHMHPGQGYMLKANSDGSFYYPGTSATGGNLSRSLINNDKVLSNTLELFSSVGLNPHAYKHSMSIISDMSASASFLSEHNLEDLSFIAYVDDVVRGITKVQTITEIDKDLLFLSVYGNKPNEKVYIRIYDEVREEEFLTSLEFGFNKNGIIGSVNSPATLSGIIPVIPEDYKLSQNYPNPFNPRTRIDFQTPEDGQVDIGIYNIRGQEVITLKSEFMQAGYGSLTWNGTDHSGTMLPTGIYFVKMEAVNYHMTRKMMLLK